MLFMIIHRLILAKRFPEAEGELRYELSVFMTQSMNESPRSFMRAKKGDLYECTDD